MNAVHNSLSNLSQRRLSIYNIYVWYMSHEEADKQADFYTFIRNLEVEEGM